MDVQGLQTEATIFLINNKVQVILNDITHCKRVWTRLSLLLPVGQRYGFTNWGTKLIEETDLNKGLTLLENFVGEYFGNKYIKSKMNLFMDAHYIKLLFNWAKNLTTQDRIKWWLYRTSNIVESQHHTLNAMSGCSSLSIYKAMVLIKNMYQHQHIRYTTTNAPKILDSPRKRILNATRKISHSPEKRYSTFEMGNLERYTNKKQTKKSHFSSFIFRNQIGKFQKRFFFFTVSTVYSVFLTLGYPAGKFTDKNIFKVFMVILFVGELMTDNIEIICKMFTLSEQQRTKQTINNTINEICLTHAKDTIHNFKSKANKWISSQDWEVDNVNTISGLIKIWNKETTLQEWCETNNVFCCFDWEKFSLQMINIPVFIKNMLDHIKNNTYQQNTYVVVFRETILLFKFLNIKGKRIQTAWYTNHMTQKNMKQTIVYEVTEFFNQLAKMLCWGEGMNNNKVYLNFVTVMNDFELIFLGLNKKQKEYTQLQKQKTDGLSMKEFIHKRVRELSQFSIMETQFLILKFWTYQSVYPQLFVNNINDNQGYKSLSQEVVKYIKDTKQQHIERLVKNGQYIFNENNDENIKENVLTQKQQYKLQDSFNEVRNQTITVNDSKALDRSNVQITTMDTGVVQRNEQVYKKQCIHRLVLSQQIKKNWSVVYGDDDDDDVENKTCNKFIDCLCGIRQPLKEKLTKLKYFRCYICESIMHIKCLKLNRLFVEKNTSNTLSCGVCLGLNRVESIRTCSSFGMICGEEIDSSIKYWTRAHKFGF